MTCKTLVIALSLALTFSLIPTKVFAALRVLTTTTDLNALVTEIGGNLIESESLSKGTQDPHFIEPKPSYMVRASKADLLISVGMGLEVGWLPNVVRGSRNPKINPGSPGYLEVGPSVEALEVPKGKLTRADGDVHPEGNPHVTLDPIRAGDIALVIAKRLGELDAPNAARYTAKAQDIKARLERKTKAWSERITKSGITKVVTFHKTLTYFLSRFQIENSMLLEPRPGLPPTAKHILEVIQKVKAENIKLILVENFFDPAVAERVVKDAPAARIALIPVAVDGDKQIRMIDDLYEAIVLSFEGK